MKRIPRVASVLALPALLILATPARAGTAGATTTAVGAGGGDAGLGGAGGASTDQPPTVTNGCSCVEADRGPLPPALLVAALAAGVTLVRRRYSAPKWTSE